MISFGNRCPRYGLSGTHSASHRRSSAQPDNAREYDPTLGLPGWRLRPLPLGIRILVNLRTRRHLRTHPRKSEAPGECDPRHTYRQVKALDHRLETSSLIFSQGSIGHRNPGVGERVLIQRSVGVEVVGPYWRSLILRTEKHLYSIRNTSIKKLR